MLIQVDCGRRSGLVVAYITAANEQIDAAREVKRAATTSERQEAAAMLARARELRAEARKRLRKHRQWHGC